MRIIGCDLHTRQQTLAMLDSVTGEVVRATLKHEGNMVREFYDSLPRPVRVGIEATGSMQWFVNLMEELGIECLVGHPAEIRAAEPRKQKHDRRDADLLLSLLAEGRFPAIWLPTKELLDLRALLRHPISGYACGSKYKMRCRALPWPMASAADHPCGHKQANRPSRLCRCRRTPHIGGMNCRRCMCNSKRRSRN
jgi:hypothetical protein